MIYSFIYIFTFFLLHVFVHADSTGNSVSLNSPGESVHRLLSQDQVNWFDEVGTGLCQDANQLEGASRILFGMTLEKAKNWCLKTDNECAGFALLESYNRATVYSTKGCTKNCDVDSWSNDPSLITQTAQDESLGIWKDAKCFRMSQTGRRALAKRRELLLALAASALSVVIADFVVSTEALAFLTAVETGFGIGFVGTLAVEEAAIAVAKPDKFTDLATQEKALKNALVGGVIGALSEVGAAAAIWSRVDWATATGTQAFTRYRWQRWAWRKYRIRPGNQIGAARSMPRFEELGVVRTRGDEWRFMLDANSESFRQAAGRWYAANPRTIANFGLTRNAAVDAAANPGWYYDISMEHFIQVGLRGNRMARFADWVTFSVLPCLPFTVSMGVLVDYYVYDWNFWEELLSNGANKKEKLIVDPTETSERTEDSRSTERNPLNNMDDGGNRRALSERPKLSYDLAENMDQINFLSTITKEQFDRLKLSQNPQNHADCRNIGEVESRWGQCDWMHAVTYNAECAMKRWNAFQKKKHTSVPKLTCGGNWVTGDASDVSQHMSDFETCPQFKSIESKHSWLIPITSLDDEITFEFCPQEGDNSIGNTCVHNGVNMGPNVYFLLESMNGTAQAYCGAENWEYNHMLRAECDVNGRFMTIKVTDKLKYSLVNGMTPAQLKESNFPSYAKGVSFDAIYFRLSVQTVAGKSATTYHVRQTCKQDERYTGFYNKVMKTTYTECIDRNYPNKDPNNADICWPDVRAHECQFCTKMGAGFEDDAHRKSLVAACENKGYTIPVCFDAELTPKKGPVTCTCDSAYQGRVGRNCYTCSDGTKSCCNSESVCTSSLPFEKTATQINQVCAISECKSQPRVPDSNTWSTCWHTGTNRCGGHCCCDDGYKVGRNHKNQQICVRCGPNE